MQVLNSKKNWLFFCLISALITLISCGGGGGSTVGSGSIESDVSVQAVAGAPMSNAKIYAGIYNAASSGGGLGGIGYYTWDKPASVEWKYIGTADAKGLIKISAADVSEFRKIGQFYSVKAVSEDGSRTFYGLYRGSSIAVNPFTTVALALSRSDMSQLGSLGMASYSDDGAERAEKVFEDIFNIAGISKKNKKEYFSSQILTNHEGLDLLFDLVDVNIIYATNKISLTNKISGETVVVSMNDVKKIPFSSADLTSVSATQISVCSEFLSGLTSSRLISEDDIYSSSFKDSGLNKQAYKNNMGSIVSTTAPFKISMPIFSGLDGNGNHVYNINILNENTKDFLSNLYAIVSPTQLNTSCQLIGNQFPFEIQVQPIIRKYERTDGVSSILTTQKMRGIEIKVGGEPFQNSINGISISKAKVEVCDAASTCQLLADLTAPVGSGTFELTDPNAGFHYVIPNPSFSLTNTLPAPIRIKLLDANNVLLATYYTKSIGAPFTDEEFAALEMPTVTNPEVIGSAASNLYSSSTAIKYNPGGTVLTSIHVGSRNGVNSSDNTKLLLTSNSGEANVPIADVSNANYRAIWINGQLPGRAGKVITKYVWAPQSQNAW